MSSLERAILHVRAYGFRKVTAGQWPFSMPGWLPGDLLDRGPHMSRSNRMAAELNVSTYSRILKLPAACMVKGFAIQKLGPFEKVHCG